MPKNEISVQLGLKDNLTKDLKRSLGGIKSFATQAASLFGRVGKALFSVKTLIAGLATGYVVRSFFRMTQQVADLHDQFHKLNLRLGISVKTLSELKYAGEQSGIKWNTFSTSLQRVVRRLEEFRSTGKGVAGQALRDLGIDQAVLAGEKLEALLPRIADGFARMNEAQRSLTSNRLFDSEGVSMHQLFGQGSGALAGYRSRAGQLGITATQADANAAAGYNDAINSMSGAWEGLKRKALTPLFSVLTSLIDKTTDYVVSIQPKISKFFEELGEKLSTIDFSTVGSTMVTIAESMVSIAGKVMLIAPTVLDLVDKTLKLALKVMPKTDAAINAEIAASHARVAREWEKVAAAKRAALAAGRGEELEGDGSDEFSAWQADIIAGREAAAERREKWGGHPAYTLSEPSIGRRKGPSQMATFWANYSEGARTAVVQTQMVASGLYSLEDAFVAGASGAARWKDALRGMFAAVLSDLTRIAFRMTIVNGLAGIGGLFNNPTEDIAAFNAANSRLNNIYFGEATAAGLATGGVIRGPASGYPVIMHGDEEVTVEPLGTRRGKGGGEVHHHHYNIQATDAPSFTRQWMGVFSEQAEMVAHKTVDKISRSRKLSGAIA